MAFSNEKLVVMAAKAFGFRRHHFVIISKIIFLK